MSQADRKRVVRNQARAAAEAAYQRFLREHPENNRNVGSTYSGSPKGRRSTGRSKRAPRG